jgi:riboflavin-specific deaminase-like protein
MRYDRLLPTPGSLTAQELLAEVRPGERAPDDRPYVLLNMVATVDGRAAIGGRSGPIGGPADTHMFGELRTITDAVMVGTGTLRAERYGRLVRDPDRRARRAAAGLAEDPVAFLLSRRLDLPWDAPLFADPAQRVVVACGEDAGTVPPGVAADVSLLPLPDHGVGPALRALRAEHGIRSVLSEGGPTLNAHLLAAGVLDELFLTVSPLLAGDPAQPGLVAGPGAGLAEPARLELRWLLRYGDELFLRYAL